jgi:hypothetical protein
MSILSSHSKPVFLLFVLFALLLAVILLRQVYKKKPLNFYLVLFVLALFAFMFFKSTAIKNSISRFISPPPPVVYLYDTDPTNNEYIMADLNGRQLRQLDRILMEEKRLCGLRLSELRLNELAANNNEIIGAYDRWRKCKDMYRSYHKVVYPDERERVLQERR